MMKTARVTVLAAGGLLAAAGFIMLRAQEPDPLQATAEAPQMTVADPSCTFFGPKHDQFVPALRLNRRADLTVQVMSQISAAYAAADFEAAAGGLPAPPGG